MFIEAVCKTCGKTFIPTYEWVYKANKKYYCSFHCYNHRHDDKPQTPINESGKVRANKKVEQYTKSGDLVKVFDSAKIAAETIGCNVEEIRKTCRGELKSYKGFVWRYQE